VGIRGGLRRSQELLLHEEVEDLLRTRTIVLDLSALTPRRKVAEREYLRSRPFVAHVARQQTEIAETDRGDIASGVRELHLLEAMQSFAHSVKSLNAMEMKRLRH